MHPEIVRVPVDPPLHHVLDVHLGLFFSLPRGAIGEYPRRPEHVVEPRVVRELIGDAVADTPARRYVRHLALRGVAMASAHRSPAPDLAAKNSNQRWFPLRWRTTQRNPAESRLGNAPFLKRARCPTTRDRSDALVCLAHEPKVGFDPLT